ncbi:MAG: CDP-alcohol phosphatidyltransferase family protein [Candidatus Nitronauta litoralis]|uniref:CDP-alcohol phosphatidyltransferase family protein n=1 Tax=Candidatus Nitronauta litoralis TaxID=2705533 RepID=A0A7T0BU36_9BACT|nr:MAG: CDP-alcohol phosphatidyltransferase family protein [Candidatus Nitronauta litoralis]
MANLIESALENGSDNARVVLILRDPPAPYKLEDWYLKPITGVPFVLLNILNLQRGGVEHLTLYHPNLKAGNGDSWVERVKEDKRCKLELNIVSDRDGLKKALEQSPWVVNGGALHRKQEIAVLLSGATDQGWVEQVNIDEVPALTEFRKTSLSGDGEKDIEDAGALVYFSGAKDRQLSQRRDFRRQSAVLLAESGLSNDSLMDRLVTRQISRQFTRFLVMTPLTPNQITFIAMITGLMAAACFWSGGYEGGVAGAVLLLVSAWIDCADGEVARLKFLESPLGGILDIWADNIVHSAVFFSIGMGLFFSTENGIYKILGTLAVIGTLMAFALLQSSLIESKMKATEEVSGKNEKEKEDTSLVDQMANRDFIYFLFALALVDQLGIFLALTAIGSNVFALWLVFLRYRGAWSSSTDLCSKNSEKLKR